MRVRWSGRQLTVFLAAALACVILTGGAFALLLGRHQALSGHSTALSASAPNFPQTGAIDPLATPPRSGSAPGTRTARHTAGRGTRTSGIGSANVPSPAGAPAGRPGRTVASGSSSGRAPSADRPAPAEPTADGTDGNATTGTPSVPAPAAPPADASVMARGGPATTGADGAGDAPGGTGSSVPAPPASGGASASATPETVRAASDGGPPPGPSTNLTVQLSDQARHVPRASDVAGALQRYFDAINAHDYQGWIQAVAPNLVAAHQSEIAWMSGFSTTTDSSIWIRRITGPSGGLPASAEVRFTSQQEASQAPADLQVGCIQWQAVYHFADAAGGGGLVIDGSSTSVSHTACG